VGPRAHGGSCFWYTGCFERIPPNQMKAGIHPLTTKSTSFAPAAHLQDELDAQGRYPRGDLLVLPPVLHRPPEVDGHAGRIERFREEVQGLARRQEGGTAHGIVAQALMPAGPEGTPDSSDALRCACGKRPTAPPAYFFRPACVVCGRARARPAIGRRGQLVGAQDGLDLLHLAGANGLASAFILS